jgi:DNA-binding MarR family transcriptional regulator
MGTHEEAQPLDCMGNIPGDTIDVWVLRLIHQYGSMNFKRSKELGIHPGQIPVLVLLHKNEGLSLREIADQLHVKPPTVTVMVQRLEKSGMVYKQPDEKDQRINRIYLTQKGKNLKEDMRIVMDDNRQKLIRGFSQQEQDQMKDYLRRMVENLASSLNLEDE